MSFNVRDFAILARDAATSTTYKPALLKAIVRAQRADPRGTLLLVDLAEHFARLYWTQTVVFHLRQAASLAREPEIIQNIRRAAVDANARSFDMLPAEARSRLLRTIASTLRIDVLRRFHIGLPAQASPLYVWSTNDSLSFASAAVEFVVNNSLTLELIANHWWARKLEKVNLAAPKLIEKIETEKIRRSNLAWFYQRVAGTDPFTCFYCDISLAAGGSHVDHVIPWSFLLDDPVWDLVHSCVPCNLQKSDRLPNVRYIDRLDLLNAQRLASSTEIMRKSIALPNGGVRGLYQAARDVEWPNAWEPLVIP